MSHIVVYVELFSQKKIKVSRNGLISCQQNHFVRNLVEYVLKGRIPSLVNLICKYTDYFVSSFGKNRIRRKVF